MSKTHLQFSRTASTMVRQRLIAAHRLAAGDHPSLAAALASLDINQMAELQQDDDDMADLVTACAGIQGLDHDSWLARLGDQLRVAVELAVIDGNMTAVMGAIRAMNVIRPIELGPYDGPDGELQRFIDGMSEAEYAEFVAMGYQDVDEPDDDRPPSKFTESATLLPFRRPDSEPEQSD